MMHFPLLGNLKIKTFVIVTIVCLPLGIYKCLHEFKETVSLISNSESTSVKFNCKAPENPIFHSQGNEDVSFYERFYKHPTKCNGTVLEMGALDGVRYSISKFFEDYLGWKSILIEADPKNFRLIHKNRPLSTIYNAAICRGENIKFIRNSKEGAVGGIEETMSETHKKDWIPKNSKSVSVPCSRLSDILNDIKHIDLFILDVEGGELEALFTMDWDISVDYWIIELDATNSSKDNAVRDLLRSKGYKKAKWDIKQYGPERGVFMNEVFSKTEIGKTVFAFALFAENLECTIYIIRNTNLVSKLFPGWEVYIYYDQNVSEVLIETLRNRPNTILIDMSKVQFKNKMLWKLLVASNPDVEKYVIFDNVSKFSATVKIAVEKWIISKKQFMALRDDSSRSLMGSVWGAQGNILPNIQELIIKHEKESSSNNYSSFINEIVWQKAILSLYTP